MYETVRSNPNRGDILPPSRRTARLKISLTDSQMLELEEQAVKRNLTVANLIYKLLAYIVADRLYDAVIDED